jgi:hypothetical protein
VLVVGHVEQFWPGRDIVTFANQRFDRPSMIRDAPSNATAENVSACTAHVMPAIRSRSSTAV